MPHIAAAKKWNNVFQLSALLFVSPLHPSERSIFFAQASVCLSKERTGNIVPPCSCFQLID
jgi:hypothetical protein